MRSLQKATVLSADDPSAWFLLARALKGTGRLEESQAAEVKAVELNQLLRDRLLTWAAAEAE